MESSKVFMGNSHQAPTGVPDPNFDNISSSKSMDDGISPYTDDMEIVDLISRRYSMDIILNHHELRRDDVDFFIEETKDNMRINLSKEIYGVDLDEVEVETKELETWWDHFKLRWFPTCLLSKYPINYKFNVLKFSATELYPDIEVDSPNKKIVKIKQVK